MDENAENVENVKNVKKFLANKKNKIPKKLEMSRIKLRKLFYIPPSELDLGDQYILCVIEMVVNLLDDLEWELDKALQSNKTCKDCIFFMQKGYCRRKYTERKADDPVCYNPIFLSNSSTSNNSFNVNE